MMDVQIGYQQQYGFLYCFITDFEYSIKRWIKQYNFENSLKNTLLSLCTTITVYNFRNMLKHF